MHLLFHWTDTSRQSDIARLKYIMNAVSSHGGEGSVSYAVFISYWQQIRETLVRLAGTDHGDVIDEIMDQEMDPLDEEHFRELLKQWKEVEDSSIEGSSKDKLNELESLDTYNAEGEP